MDFEKQIRKYRKEMNLSQEELADKVYVSRQTISNWENGKSCPDIQSLVLLSTIFNVSLDQLIKGDIEVMKEKIKADEIEKFNRYGMVYSILLLITIISAVPLKVWLGIWAVVPWGIIAVITIIYAFKVESLKKDYNVQTYKEIVAFTEGKRLDEIDSYKEEGKRPYQKILLAIASGVFALTVCFLTDMFINGV